MRGSRVRSYTTHWSALWRMVRVLLCLRKRIFAALLRTTLHKSLELKNPKGTVLNRAAWAPKVVLYCAGLVSDRQ